MKAIYLIPMVFITALSVCSQGIQHKVNLPGFVQLNDTLFMGKYEIDIREYGRFLTITRKETIASDFIQKTIPIPNYTDWTLWDDSRKKLIRYDSIYELTSDTTISFTGWTSNWPIVNLSKEQVNNYCLFRIKDYLFFYKKTKPKLRKILPANLYFRLPTIAEWMLAANAQGRMLLPMCKDVYENDDSNQSHPTSVFSGSENPLGILNILGNVAEMVQDSDWVFGGSYLDAAEDCRSDSKRPFSRNNATGFRIVAVIRAVEN